MVNFIEADNILDSRQSGYRGSRSTQIALLRFCQYVRRAVDGGRITILVLFDFSKALDTVGHLMLFKALCDGYFRI